MEDYGEDPPEVEAWSGNRDVSGRGRSRRGYGRDGSSFGRRRGSAMEADPHGPAEQVGALDDLKAMLKDCAADNIRGCI